MRSQRPRARTFLLLLLLLPLALGAGPCERETVTRQVVLTAGPDMEFQIRQAFITAQPGDEIVIPAGVYDIRTQLALDVPNVTVTGAGMDETVLSFANQVSGAEGILATADAFTIKDLGVWDTKGDGIKVEDVDGVSFIRVRVEWSAGPQTENGSYGLYPVRSRNIIAQGCVIRGASDAGIYVGQSENIVVRANTVEQNVAGIEIENSKFADVYGNSVTDNTGGVLVFDLPNIEVQGGQQVRVFANHIYDNDRPNFAPEGNIVAIVPGGTGVIVMANDDVEIFDNLLIGNDSANVFILSYDIVGSHGDPNYDAYPEKLHIHDNYMVDGGTAPKGLAVVLPIIFGSTPLPDIMWDGYVNAEHKQKGGILPPALAICAHDNGPGPVRFGNFNFGDSPSVAEIDHPQHACSHETLTKPDVAAYPEAPPFETPFSEEEIEALCTATGEGVNWAALQVECPLLSDYRLFLTGDPRVQPNGGIPYDLNTPLFSDYTSKYRVVFVPPGETIPYDATEVLDFPVGTVIAKTFAERADHRVPGGTDDLIETRLLVHRESGWVGIPYIWDETDSEASLSLGGGAAEIAWIDANGDDRATRYEIPNVNQCRSCHGSEGGTAPIGPSVRQLNKTFDYGATEPMGTVAEQLDVWSSAFLTGAPAPGSAPKLTDWSDEGASLDDRARAYLEANCAHCHSPEGRAKTSALFLEADRPFDTAVGLCKPPVAAGGGSGGLDYDIVPGSPSDSILFFRMASMNPGIRMPELAISVVHDEGLALVGSWISSLPGSCGD